MNEPTTSAPSAPAKKPDPFGWVIPYSPAPPPRQPKRRRRKRKSKAIQPASVLPENKQPKEARVTTYYIRAGDCDDY